MIPKAVVFAPAAEIDLEEIWYHIALNAPGTADRIVDNIRKRCDQLSVFPDSGPSRREIAADARSLNEGRYVILYRIFETTIEIVRVVHGARDLTSFL